MHWLAEALKRERLMSKPAPKKSECEYCYGCGHVCTRCKYGLTGCYCDEDFGLDTEEIAECAICRGTGEIIDGRTLRGGAVALA